MSQDQIFVIWMGWDGMRPKGKGKFGRKYREALTSLIPNSCLGRRQFQSKRIFGDRSPGAWRGMAKVDWWNPYQIVFLIEELLIFQD